MQYENIAINKPYIGLFSTFVNKGSYRAYKMEIYDKIHLQIAKNVEK